MAAQVRSVRACEGVAVERIECAWCGLVWNRRPTKGQVPRFCSATCRQANWRDGLRQKRDGHRARKAQVARFHAEFDQISAHTPLKPERVVPLLYELAGVDPAVVLPVSRLYRTAAAAWHPDRSGGDYKVFQLLQEAHRLARPDAR
ncbi:J domain-containing protein [Streptomyces sp. 900105755]